jgi:hypothetical protein
MTSLTTVELEAYYERVRAALADLAPESREELLEELPDHLAEVAADEGGALVDRLGDPEAYAAELRAAAGLDAPAAPAKRRPTFTELASRASELAQRADVSSARLVGYPRLTELGRALQPGWWLLRGWIVAQALSGTHDRASWHGFVPGAGGSAVLGLLLLLAAVILSLWVGTRSRNWTGWPRRISAVASILIALWGAGVLAHNVGGTLYQYSSYNNDGSYDPLNNIGDVHVYDSQGNLVPEARLYDQSGNPVRIGSGACLDGNAAAGSALDTWTYPLCPADPGPFRAGPGAVTPAVGADLPGPGSSTGGSAAPSATSTPSAAPSASSAPTGSGRTTPKATPRPRSSATRR